jgi:hypothetical protein
MTNNSSISWVAVWGALLSAGCSSSDKSASAPAQAAAGSPDSLPTVGAAMSGTGGRAVWGGSGTSTSANTDAGQRPRDAAQPSADAARPAADDARPAEGSQSGDDASTSTEMPGSGSATAADPGPARSLYCADMRVGDRCRFGRARGGGAARGPGPRAHVWSRNLRKTGDSQLVAHARRHRRLPHGRLVQARAAARGFAQLRASGRLDAARLGVCMRARALRAARRRSTVERSARA